MRLLENTNDTDSSRSLIERYWLAWAILILAVIYGPIIAAGKLSNFDDPGLIPILEPVRSIAEYLELRTQGKVMDVQPLRDLSYWVDHKLTHAFGFLTFHLTNAALFLGIAASARLLWQKAKLSARTSTWLSLFFLANPIFASTVAWASARKHLLASLLILQASLHAWRWIEKSEKRLPWLSILFYLLAMSAQPMAILWPLFPLALIFQVHGKDWKDWMRSRLPTLLVTALALGAIAVTTAYLNDRYYSVFYLTQSRGVPKYLFGEDAALSWKLLSLGRFYFQAVLPIFPNVWDHYPAHPAGMAGIALLVLLPFLGWKLRKQAPHALFWQFAALAVLAPVWLKQTNVFAADAYLLLPVVCLWTSVVQWISQPLQFRFIKRNQLALLLGMSLIVAGAWRARPIASAFQSPLDLWEIAYELEPTPQNTQLYAKALYFENRPAQALPVVLRLIDWKSGMLDLDLLFVHVLNGIPEFTVKDRLRLLKENWFNAPWTEYYRAVWLSEAGDAEQAWKFGRRLLELPELRANPLYGENWPKIETRMIELCRAAKQKDCPKAKANSL